MVRRGEWRYVPIATDAPQYGRHKKDRQRGGLSKFRSVALIGRRLQRRSSAAEIIRWASINAVLGFE